MWGLICWWRVKKLRVMTFSAGVTYCILSVTVLQSHEQKKMNLLSVLLLSVVASSSFIRPTSRLTDSGPDRLSDDQILGTS